MAMKAISTPIGSITMATSALRACIRKTMHTSCRRSRSPRAACCFSVSMARRISSERSYTGVNARRPWAGSRREFRDLRLDVARSPRARSGRSARWRCRETTSPSPFSSVTPRRSSGPSSTRADVAHQHRRALLDFSTICRCRRRRADSRVRAPCIPFRQAPPPARRHRVLLSRIARALCRGSRTARRLRGSTMTLYCFTKPPTLATSATPVAPWRAA